jgi:hypothetical protein
VRLVICERWRRRAPRTLRPFVCAAAATRTWAPVCCWARERQRRALASRHGSGCQQALRRLSQPRQAGQPACPVTTPDRRGRADAHLWRRAGAVASYADRRVLPWPRDSARGIATRARWCPVGPSIGCRWRRIRLGASPAVESRQSRRAGRRAPAEVDERGPSCHRNPCSSAYRSAAWPLASRVRERPQTGKVPGRPVMRCTGSTGRREVARSGGWLRGHLDGARAYRSEVSGVAASAPGRSEGERAASRPIAEPRAGLGCSAPVCTRGAACLFSGCRPPSRPPGGAARRFPRGCRAASPPARSLAASGPARARCAQALQRPGRGASCVSCRFSTGRR